MLARLKQFFLRNTSPKQTIAKNVAWLTLGEIFGRLIRMLFVIYVARILGAEGYGVFSYVLGLAGFFTMFSSAGVSSVFLRNASQTPKSRYEFFSVTFFIQLVLLILTIALVIFVAPLFSHIVGVRLLFVFASFLIAFDGFRGLAFAVFRFSERMELEALTAVVTNLAITGFGFLAIFLAPNPLSLIMAYAAGAGVGALIGTLLLKNWFARIFRCFQKDLIRPILLTTSAMFLTTVFGRFMFHIDMIMLGWWRSAEEIGLYAAAQRIVFLLIVLPDILAVSVFPLLSRLVKLGDSDRVERLMERSVILLFSISLPLVVGGIVLARPLLIFVYGQGFASSSLFLQLLLFSLLLLFPSRIILNFIFVHNKQRIIATSAGVGAFGNVVLNVFLIPAYGAAGSAIGTFFSLLINQGFLWYVAKRLQPFRTFRYLPRIFIASLLGPGILAYVLYYFAGLHVLMVILLSALFYFAFLYILRDPVITEFQSIFRRFLSSSHSNTQSS
ncbi:hypothetical protein CL629_04610 [bacterium]|nr:hypothetical protein [bacterium]|tara:strand:+ start:794 stop:2293 length:1500 start_codon:yes stop_codon:yes gene_type:complete